MPWLTPDGPLPSSAEGTIFLPDDTYLQACLWGAIAMLASPENWEEYGSVSPDEVAGYFAELYRLSRQ